MDRISRFVTGAGAIRSQDDDDFADRLSSRYTVVQLVVFAILIGLTQVRSAPRLVSVLAVHAKD